MLGGRSIIAELHPQLCIYFQKPKQQITHYIVIHTFLHMILNTKVLVVNYSPTCGERKVEEEIQ